MMNKSLLSKLMARENLEVIEGSFDTASFDPENRVLRLPILKEEFKETNALFIGHEVGHALYTPNYFSHDVKKEIPECDGIPHVIVNIVEDVRIERMIREFYPGLVNDFLKGYKKLLNDDFFGIKDIDPQTLEFLDRLNLKAKLNKFIDLDFTETETVMMKKVFAIKTFEDTIRVSRELMAFIAKEQEEQQQQQQEQQGQSNETSEQGMPSDKSGGTDTEELESEQQSPEYGGTEQKDVDDMLRQLEQEMYGEKPDQDSAEEKGDTKFGGTETNEKPNDFAPNYESITDDAFRKKEQSMFHNAYDTTIIRVRKKQINKEFIYTDLDLQQSLARKRDSEVDFDNYQAKYADIYKKFIREVKPSVNAMVQQFELKKSAQEFRKAKESTTGSIDVNKLWQYKLDDHIFKTLVAMPDAKNHGLLMYIDYSSSMVGRIYETLKQAVVMVMFAKRVGIPFELYSFTTNRVKWEKYIAHDEFDYVDWGVGMVKIADSSWKKSKLDAMLERAMFNAWLYGSLDGWRRISKLVEEAFQLGGTPLIETISISYVMANEFVKKHHIEKMNVVFLTDGEAQEVRLRKGLHSYDDTVIWDIEGHGNVEMLESKEYYWRNNRSRFQAETLLKGLRKKYNVIGFFLTGVRGHVDRKTGYKVYTDYNGYDKYIVIHDKRLQAVNDDFVTSVDGDTDIDTTDKKRLNAIKRDFKKFQHGKKSNKLIAQEIANMVA